MRLDTARGASDTYATTLPLFSVCPAMSPRSRLLSGALLLGAGALLAALLFGPLAAWPNALATPLLGGGTGRVADWAVRAPEANGLRWAGSWPEWFVLAPLFAIVLLILLYTGRHYGFTLNRLFGTQRHPYATLDTMDWPRVTVLVPAHNEETVVADALHALLASDYPEGRLVVMPVNDRSSDGTRARIDAVAAAHPGRLQPFHRESGAPGKAAALADACRLVDTPVVLIFDADYVPGRDLVKQLVAPFADPQVGAVMGRVVPQNGARNLLTRLLELERAGGYQVDQQARMNLGFVAQYGGTVGGIRMRALYDVGGWDPATLAEDTDLTCRLAVRGWTIAYSNRFECYEEVPETWAVRRRQISRWAKGHTHAMRTHSARLARTPYLRLAARLDALMLMGVYAMPPLVLVGWGLALLAFYLGLVPVHGLLAVLAVAVYNTSGNFAVFFEIATAVRLDGTRRRARLLPLSALGFLVSLTAVSDAVVRQLFGLDKAFVWNKTERFRTAR